MIRTLIPMFLFVLCVLVTTRADGTRRFGRVAA
jgi:hypothetical protein